jgi:hypothetical protein
LSSSSDTLSFVNVPHARTQNLLTEQRIRLSYNSDDRRHLDAAETVVRSKLIQLFIGVVFAIDTTSHRKHQANNGQPVNQKFDQDDHGIRQSGNVMGVRPVELTEQARPEPAAENPPGRNQQRATVGSLSRNGSRREQKQRSYQEVIDVSGDIREVGAPAARLQRRQRDAQKIGRHHFKAMPASERITSHRQ